MTVPRRAAHPADEARVKLWLRSSCHIDRKVSTPLETLWRAYVLQGGNVRREMFARIVGELCPGLSVSGTRGHEAVHGVAPRWR